MSFDPNIGRWTTEDPIGFADDVNPYRYVKNNPTNATDPTGLYLVAANAGAASKMVAHLKDKYKIYAKAYPIGGKSGNGREFIHILPGQKDELARLAQDSTVPAGWRKNLSDSLESDSSHVESFEDLSILFMNETARARFGARANPGARDLSEAELLDIQSILARERLFGKAEEPAPPPKRVWIRIEGEIPERYQGYPTIVDDVLPIVWDHLMSGHPDEAVRQRAQPILRKGFESYKYFQVMEEICSFRKGDGWKPEPVEFILTGLEFAKPGVRGVGDIPDPRVTDLELPLRIPLILRKEKGLDFEYQQEKATRQVYMGYFWIRGYWVFNATKEGEEPVPFAIAIEGQGHNMSHAPFGPGYAREIDRLKAKYGNDIMIGRPHDAGPSGRQELIDARGGRIDINDLLKVRPGEKPNIPEKNIIPVSPDYSALPRRPRR